MTLFLDPLDTIDPHGEEAQDVPSLLLTESCDSVGSSMCYMDDANLIQGWHHIGRASDPR